MPSFREALATFKSFLEKQGAPGRLLWVTRQIVTSHRRRIWVRTDDPDDASRFAESSYEAGRQKGLGISLRAVFRIEEATACCVWVPKDEMEASYAMQPRSLKCQLPIPLIVATEVTSPIRWRLLRLLNRYRRLGDLWADELPSK